MIASITKLSQVLAEVLRKVDRGLVPPRRRGEGLGEIRPGCGIWEFIDPTDSRRHEAFHGTPLSFAEGREGVAISKEVGGGRRFS